ncbi:MAG: hypothetical protein MSS80_08205 [Mollicutes bacterium]|nr:hypothetical protein [Mollicutes bacterium]
MFKNKELIKDINELRNNINMKKYDNLQSDLKDFGNLLYEDFGKEWQDTIIHNELLRYKKALIEVQK